MDDPQYLRCDAIHEAAILDALHCQCNYHRGKPCMTDVAEPASGQTVQKHGLQQIWAVWVILEGE